MPEEPVHPLQIVNERLQSRIGNLIGQIELQTLQIELLIKERDNLRAMLIQAGKTDIPSSQVTKTEEITEHEFASGGVLDTYTGDQG